MLVAFRDPFDPFSLRTRVLPNVLTLRQIAREMRPPEEFWEHGVIAVDGLVVERWDVLPPANARDVTLHLRLLGGGGGEGGGKNPLALIGSLAILAATGFVAGGGLATRFGFQAFAQGTLGANALAAGIALGGQALLAGLQPTPGQQGASQIDASRTSSVASADGNLAAANGALPCVVGTHKVFPPFACEPLVYYDGPDEVVEAAYVLAGPHDLQDIRIDDTAIDELSGVTVQTWEGWPGRPEIEVVDRYSTTTGARSEIQPHALQPDGLTVDLDAENGFVPQPFRMSTAQDADEFWIALSFPQGLNRNGSESSRIRVPFRLRIRNADGGHWINLPEIHYRAAALEEARGTIRLLFSDDAPSQGGAAPDEGFVEARRASPGQNADPISADFAADSVFGTSGDEYLSSNNVATSGVQNVIAGRYACDIYLPSATFPKGRYEVEITRGVALLDASWSPSSYAYGGSVWDLFGSRGTGSQVVAQNQKSIYSAAFLVRSTSIKNETPFAGRDLCVIALRARNRQLGPLSVLASRYVPRLDGTGWETTSNPAPHLRDVYAGLLNSDPVPDQIIDDADLLAWEAHCAAQGHEVNAIIEDATVDSAATLIAQAGFAAPRQSSRWGVVQARDVSAEAPALVLTPRNSSGFAFTKDFSPIDDGVRVTFRDRDRDYAERQIVEPEEAVGGRLIQRVYDGLVTEAQVRQRARFELAAARARRALYTVTAGAESLIVRRGDLIGVEHDVISQETGRARVVGWTEDPGGNLTTVTLDDSVSLQNEPGWETDAPLADDDDLRPLGETYVLAIRSQTGILETWELANATGQTRVLTIANPAPSVAIHNLALVVVGPRDREFGRFIVTAMEPREDLTARVTMVREAPEIWAQ